MAIYHLLYRTTTAGLVPSSVDMPAGRLALNLVDERIYFTNQSGTVVQPNVRPHTHTIGDITDLNKGEPNGVASLDSNGVLVLSQMPFAPINTVSGTSLVLGTATGTDVVQGRYTRTTAATAVTITVNNAAATAPQEFHVRQSGAGAVTFVAGAGVTINPQFGSGLVLAGQGSLVTLKCVGTNVYDLFGQLGAA